MTERPGAQAPVFAVLLLMLLCCFGCSPETAPSEATEPTPETADLVIINARIYSLNWPEPDLDGTPAPEAPCQRSGSGTGPCTWRNDAQALAVRGGSIVAVGDNAAISALIGPDTRVLDMPGATVLPGLVDPHTHVFELGARLNRVDLYGVETEAEAVERVALAAENVPAGEWVVGQGWDEGAWANDYPDLGLLSERVPDHPVFLRSLHGFAGWGNRLAFERAGITADTQPPVGGKILTFDDGEPSGMLLNHAVTLLDNAIPKQSAAEREAEVLLALEHMARDGFIAVHEAGLTAENMTVLERLEAAGRLPIRVYAMLSIRDEPLARQWLKRGPDRDVDSFLVTRAVEAYYDSALGTRGARLLEDYQHPPGHRGVGGGDDGFNQALAADFIRAGFQLGIHAIGDAGNHEALDFIESVYADARATKGGRHRIEHAQVVDPEDMPRFAELGVIASMEPLQAVEGMAWAEEVLGPERVRYADAWRSLRRAGVRLTFNADNAGSDSSIFYGLHAAITRRDRNLEPTGGWYPEQNMTVEEAIRGYTSWSAYAAFMEADTGILAAGRWADITVMNIDPFTVAKSDPAALLDGVILATIVAGKVVYVRP